MSSIAISILPWGVVDGNVVDGIDDDGKDDDDGDGNDTIKSRNFSDRAHSIARWTYKKMPWSQ